MHTDPIPPFNQLGAPLGVCVADGHGIELRVERQHLIVGDGIGRSRRERRFHKATSDLKRIVVLGTTGYISLEAVRWLADARVPLTQIDPEGRLLITSQPMGSDRAALRRAQALALANETGIEIVRYVLGHKLDGQAFLAEQLGGDRNPIDEARDQLDRVHTLDQLMLLEAAGANHYWYAWADVECRFIRNDQKLVPDHWRLFGTRGSRFNSSGPRGAANPINAILNYLYALLEAESVFACHGVGLDPGMGILHADQRSRDSFALDLMEPARPFVDRWILKFLESHKFGASDFYDTRRGTCRIAPKVTHHLAETTLEWANAVAPYAEHVAIRLADTPGLKIDRIPTPLTGSNRSIARPARPRKVDGRSKLTHCNTCGSDVGEGRTQCDGCLPLVQEEGARRYVAEAHNELQARRAAGEDPAHGGEAATQRGNTNRGHQLTVYEWNQEHTRAARSVFIEEILPGIQNVSINDLANATQLTPGYCSFIRRGLKIPHQRHWATLRKLAAPNVVQARQ